MLLMETNVYVCWCCENSRVIFVLLQVNFPLKNEGAWAQEGGRKNCRERHGNWFHWHWNSYGPQLQWKFTEQTYPVPEHFSGICEVTLDFPSRSCNMNLVVVSFILQHLLQPGGYLMQLRPILLLLMVVVMERNHGIPVIVTGHNFGNIGGIAPSSQ